MMPPLPLSTYPNEGPESKESHTRKALRGEAVDESERDWYISHYSPSGGETGQSKAFPSSSAERYRAATLTASPTAGRGAATVAATYPAGFYQEPQAAFSAALPANPLQYQSAYLQDLGSSNSGDESFESHRVDSEDTKGVAFKESTTSPRPNSEDTASAPNNPPGKDPSSFQIVIPNRARNIRLSQLAIEDILEDDFSDVEDQPSRRKVKNTPLGLFRCEHPSCWDKNDKFRFKVFAELASHYKNDHPNPIREESFPCDYPSCRRSGDEDAFTRKDAYRDHLREYHMEDMAKRHRTPKREQDWLSSRIVSPGWWRCVRCLYRITVVLDGWVCPSCKQTCEPERLESRKISVWKSDGAVLKIERESAQSQQSIVSFDEFREARSKSQFTGSSSGDGTDGTSASQTIKPSIPKQAEQSILSDLSTSTARTKATDDIAYPGKLIEASGIHAAIEFSHIEYKSHKFVPFTTIKQLGHGSLGSVDAVCRKGEEGGIVLARKVVRLPNMARKRLLPLIQQEVAVLRELSHRHIVHVISTYETTSVPRQFGILISPAGDEDLSHFLERVGENDFPEEDIQRLKKWQYCLASAVAYIHSRNIRHKDIKPSNAICKDDEIYLTDFGSAHQFSSGLTSSTEGYAVGVTKMYNAPEVVHEDRRGRPADVYSLGCVFSEMITVINKRGIEEFHDFRSEPVPDEPDRMTLCYHATAHKMEDWFATLDDPTSFALISKMMAQDQKLRPTADQVLIMIAEYHGSTICNCGASINPMPPPSRGSSLSQALPESKAPFEVGREDKKNIEQDPVLPSLKQRIDAWYAGVEVENNTAVSINSIEHPSSTNYRSLVANTSESKGLPFLGAHATKQINKYILKPLLDKTSLEHFVPSVIGCSRKIPGREVVCLRDIEQDLIVSAAEASSDAALFLDFCFTAISFVRPTVEHLTTNEQIRLETRTYTTEYFNELIDQAKQWAYWIEVREFLRSQHKSAPVTAVYTPVQGRPQIANNPKGPIASLALQDEESSRWTVRWICREPLERWSERWAEAVPVNSLSECTQCSVQFSWESFDTAMYHLRAEHFAADAWPEGLSSWVEEIHVPKDG